MISIGNPTGGTLLGFGAKKCLNDANTPGENSTPELVLLKIVLYSPELYPIPYKSSENALETLETRKTSKNPDFFMETL